MERENLKKKIEYPLFVLGDLSGFWALFADNLANIIILSSVLIEVVKFPLSIVFGHVIPGIGVSLIVGLIYYSHIAKRVAEKEGRCDVTALPYGISTPVMFAYLFGIIVPIAQKSDPITAWRVGVAATFLGGIIEVSGAILGEWLKRNLPRASMLGTLSGIALAYIATVPMAELFEKPIIGFSSMAIVLIGLVAQKRLPFGIPAGFMAIILGIIIGSFTGDVKIVIKDVGFYPPIPVFGDIIVGIKFLFHEHWILGIVVPVEIYNFLETMNNVESAEAEGDRYPVSSCQVMDGIGTILGALFGSMFPTTVYIGHPGYKKLGARRGYTLGVGIVMLIVALSGLASLLYNLIPVASVASILVYIGIIMTAQAFNKSPQKHAIAVSIAIIPHISNLLTTKLNSFYAGLKTFGIELPALSNENLIKALLSQGVHYTGHQLLGHGAIVTGMIWGALTAFLIDGEYIKAEVTVLVAIVLSYFGIIHRSGFSHLFFGYLIIGVLLLYYLITKIYMDRHKTKVD